MLLFLQFVNLNLKHFITDEMEWKWMENDLHVPV